MCSAAFITLGCVLYVEMIIVITQWKAADERLSPSDELSVRPCLVQSAQVLFLSDVLLCQSGLCAA